MALAILCFIVGLAFWPGMAESATSPHSWRHYPRLSEASAVQFSSMDGIPPLIALMEIRRALKAAPNSPRLIFWLTYQRMRAGDRLGAGESLARLEALAPHWHQSKLAKTNI